MLKQLHARPGGIQRSDGGARGQVELAHAPVRRTVEHHGRAAITDGERRARHDDCVQSERFGRQGTAADLIKLSMIAVFDWIAKENLGTRMVMQVHDELVLEVPDAELDGVRSRIPELMAGVAELDVPLVADVGTGPNWEQAH